MKKVFSVLLAVVMLLSVFPGIDLSANAAGNDCREVLEKSVDLDEFSAVVGAGLAACEEYINIKNFGIAANQANQEAITYFVRYYMPGYFHLKKISYSISTSNSQYASLKITYDTRYNTPAKYAAARQQMNEQVNTLLQGIAGNTALSDVYKALLIHDRLVSYLAFDMGAYTGNVNEDSFNLVGVFFNRTAVCNGYSIAYAYLMNLVGIRCLVVNSPMLEHAWNIVYIGGAAYYVDCTWDDPIYTFPGYVNHENFLRSAQGFVQTGHAVNGQTDYQTSVAVNNTKYDTYFWQNSCTEFQLIDNAVYYIDNENALLKCATPAKTIVSVQAQWMPDETHYYFDNYARLVSDGTSLFLNLTDSVYQVDLVTNSLVKLYTPDVSGFGAYYSIYGLRYADGNFYCSYYNSANFNDYASVANYIVAVPHIAYRHLTVSFDVEKGMVTGAGRYVKGTTARVEAKNKQGYVFAGFYRDGVLLENGSAVIDVEMAEDVSLEAKFDVCEHPATAISVSTVEPTCDMQGYLVERCGICGAETKSDFVPALGHKWGRWSEVTASTCQAEGVCKRVCERDATHVETAAIAKKDHVPAEQQTKINDIPPTCTQAGSYQMAILCVNCGEALETETFTVNATGHGKTTARVIAPTATALGYTLHTCTVCGQVVKTDAYKAPTGKPVGFKCKARTANAQAFSWTKNADVTGFQLQISNAAGTKWVMGVNTTASAYTFKNLTPGGAYKVRMRYYIKAPDGKYYFGAWAALLSPTLPAGTTMLSYSSTKTTVTPQWKYNKAVSGYQIQYGAYANFSGAKTITVKNPKQVKVVLKGLRANRYYYVRIRTYKTIASANYFSTWSATYRVKTKK